MSEAEGSCINSMANKKRTSRKRRFNPANQVLPVEDESVLGTLANVTVLRSGLTNLSDDFWFQAADLSFTMDDHTGGEGPLVVGIAHGDLSVVEIKECLEAKPTNRGDIVTREQARRPVRVLGQFDGGAASEKLYDGQLRRYPVKMYVAEGVELNMFTFNRSGGALTTGTRIITEGYLYGTWK